MKFQQALLRRTGRALPVLAVWAAVWAAPLAAARADSDEEQFCPAAVAAKSPAAEVVPPLEAVRKAQAYVATHADTDFMVGSGESMLPLYRDHTALVLRRLAISQFEAGMTVVFSGDQGFPVAHVLVRRTSRGWISMGVNNSECDRTRICEDNYIGVVVKAFEPSGSPLVALLDRPVASRPTVGPQSPVQVSAQADLSKPLLRVAPLRPALPRGGAALASFP